ncbi:alpha/beta hydrolase [Nocardioides dubius]|uniref:Alpha/beta hydrolase n=1 Tax=Nocardioides dubius TaxID=317019 RepID=A0ABN1TXN6_9ACTN
MALEPQIAGMLQFMADSGYPPIHESSVHDARKGMVAMAAVCQVAGGPIPVDVSDLEIAGRPARCYRPLGAADGVARPTVLFLHGGGFVIGDLDTHDQPCRRLAVDLDAVVVALDYRLAPEHPFPAGAEDAVAAAREIAASLEAFGGSDRLGVAGDSAGGNLAAVVAQQVPEVSAQLLIYPSVDALGDYPSRAENAEGYLLEAATMVWFFGHYVTAGADATDPRLSPLHGVRAGLAPAVVVTAGFDPLRDEGLAYAAALREAGVAVESLHAEELIHGFLDMGKMSPGSEQTVTAMHQAFARLLNVT